MVRWLPALVAQVGGALLVIAAAWVWPQLRAEAWLLGGLQGLCAAAISRLLGQPWWWLPMHLVFLPAAYGLLLLALPAWVYLSALVGLALVFWGTVRGDVPLFVSSSAVAEALATLAQRESASRFADLGAGVGSVARPLALRLPDLEIEGWETAPLPWLLARLRCRGLPRARVIRQSFWEVDLSHYDLVYAFLSPAVMPRLSAKLKAEMRPGRLFISSSFPLPDRLPEARLELADRRQTTLFCYRFGNPNTTNPGGGNEPAT